MNFGVYNISSTPSISDGFKQRCSDHLSQAPALALLKHCQATWERWYLQCVLGLPWSGISYQLDMPTKPHLGGTQESLRCPNRLKFKDVLSLSTTSIVTVDSFGGETVKYLVRQQVVSFIRNVINL